MTNELDGQTKLPFMPKPDRQLDLDFDANLPRCNRCNAALKSIPCQNCGCPEYRLPPGTVTTFTKKGRQSK